MCAFSGLRPFFRPSITLLSRKLMTMDKFKDKSCLCKKNYYLYWFDSCSFLCMFRNSRKTQVAQLLGQMIKPINRRKLM